MFIVYCLLFVVCCLLFIVCCLLFCQRHPFGSCLFLLRPSPLPRLRRSRALEDKCLLFILISLLVIRCLIFTISTFIFPLFTLNFSLLSFVFDCLLFSVIGCLFSVISFRVAGAKRNDYKLFNGIGCRLSVVQPSAPCSMLSAPCALRLAPCSLLPAHSLLRNCLNNFPPRLFNLQFDRRIRFNNGLLQNHRFIEFCIKM